MRKIWISIFLLVSVFFLGTPAMAEEYVSRDFPSNEIILKNLGGELRVFGKTDGPFGGNNLFEVYLQDRSGQILKFNLIRLDTNRWIFRGMGKGDRILQK